MNAVEYLLKTKGSETLLVLLTLTLWKDDLDL